MVAKGIEDPAANLIKIRAAARTVISTTDVHIAQGTMLYLIAIN